MPYSNCILKYGEVEPKYDKSEIMWYRIKKRGASVPPVDTTDCTFIVENQGIRAHKSILIKNSPVFTKMFCGGWSSDPVVITDITLYDFSQMLNYLYKKKIRVNSVVHAWSLFYIAHKYELSSFSANLIGYLEQHVTLNNLVLCYEYAEMYDVSDLKPFFFLDMVDYFRGLFHTDYHMKPSTLLSLLDDDKLNIFNNFDLIVFVLKWAFAECDLRGVDKTVGNIIDLLESLNILKYLVVLDFNITQPLDKLLRLCCELIKEKGAPSFRQYSPKPSIEHCITREIYKISHRADLNDKTILYTHLIATTDVALFGLAVSTEDKPFCDIDDNYNGEIHIQILKYNTSNVINETKYRGLIKYEGIGYIPLSKVVYLKKTITYTIKISYRNFDMTSKRSVICRYYCNEVETHRFRTCLTFFEVYGGVIKGLQIFPC